MDAFSPKGRAPRPSSRTQGRRDASSKMDGAMGLHSGEALARSRDADVVHLFLPTPNFLWIADRVKLSTGKPVVASPASAKNRN